MVEPTTAADVAAREQAQDGADERDELQHELDRRGTEILRLRDLLLVRDAELGAALGQLAQLETVSRTLMMAAGRVQRRVPWAMRLAGAMFRLLRGRSGRSGG